MPYGTDVVSWGNTSTTVRTVLVVAIEIDDVRDPRLADYRGLRERGRESDEYFIVEGLTAIERLL